MFTIDLTTNKVIVAYNQNDDVQLWSFPWTAAFRDNGDGINVSIGESEVTTDEKTAVLHDLRDNLSNIHDNETQTEIISQLLSHIYDFAKKFGDIEDPRTCIILPYGYSSNLLDSITKGFEQAELRLSNIVNECVSAIIYFFETSNHSLKLRANPSGESFCFINATMDPATAFLVDYKEIENERMFVVKDYYVKSGVDDNSTFPNVSVPGLKTVVFGDPSLIKPTGKVVDVVESKDKCRVMVAGAMIIGLARFKSGRTYTIEGAMGFGIQTNSDSFYEIITKETLMQNPKMPISQNKVFYIENISHDVNINLLCGFSDRIGGAVYLGTITLMESWFPQKNGEIVVTIELESMHSGKFSVTLAKNNVKPIVKQFNVPGWLG
jgi:hypothetical protein